MKSFNDENYFDKKTQQIKVYHLTNGKMLLRVCCT